MNLHLRRSAALLCLPVVALAMTACGGGSSSSDEGKASFGVKATGKFGEKPDLTIPSGDAPSELKAEVLSEGDGKAVVSGETLVANYLGQTWKPKNGKENIFDNSYDKHQPLGIQIGTGGVIQGWDKALVGKKAGSRILMTVPPELGYGKKGEAKSGQQEHELAGETLVFVVDIVASLGKDQAADGEPISGSLPAGFPKITSVPGKKPTIDSVKGVKVGSSPKAALLLVGKGEPIDAKKSLAVELVQTDAATGKQSQETWGRAPELVEAASVLGVAPALKGQKIGSRVAILAPGQSGTAAAGASIIIVDVIGQY